MDLCMHRGPPGGACEGLRGVRAEGGGGGRVQGSGMYMFTTRVSLFTIGS